MKHAAFPLIILPFILSAFCLSCNRKTLQTVTESRTVQLTADTLLVNRMLSIIDARIIERETRQSINTSAVTLINDCTVIVTDEHGNVLECKKYRNEDNNRTSDKSNERKNDESAVKTFNDSSSVASIHKDVAEMSETHNEVKIAEKTLGWWETIKNWSNKIIVSLCFIVIGGIIWRIHRKR